MTSSGETPHFADSISAPPLGPVNRSSFFEQQERNRTATWRLSVVCVFAVFCTGMVLSLILAPPLFGLAVLGLSLAKKYGSVPPELWHAFQAAGNTFVAILQHFSNNRTPLPPLNIVLYTAIGILLPGMIVQLLLWLGIRGMFLHAGAGGVLLRLGARDPRLEDLKEKKLVDVVEEMAIAGGVPSPKVKLLDSAAGNAAIVGASRQDATLVISRSLLDALDRDELQAVVGHLIASAGNGDLRIAMTMVSVYQAFGLLDSLINAPFGSHARRALWRLLRMAFRKGGPADADEVSDWLTQGLRNSGDDDATARAGRTKNGCLSTLLLPVVFFNASLKLTMGVLSGLLFEPAAAMLWRTRRYLADATAVQLTRNPDALANALQTLKESGGLIPGGKWASHLFIVGQEARGMPPELARRVAEMRKSGAQPTRQDMMNMALEAMAQDRTATRAGARAARIETLEEATGGGMVSLHPPLEKRLKRLQAQGAHYAAVGSTRKKSLLGFVILWTFLTPLILLSLGAILAAVAVCIMLNFLFVTMAFAVILAIVRLIP